VLCWQQDIAMHELSVTQSVLEIATRHAQKAGATRIIGLNLVIGQLSSIVDDSVQFYWDIVSQGTLAEGAILNFRRIPIELNCLDCDEKFHPSEDDFACPICGSIRIKVLSGEEFFVESIEVQS
jgi:hydrogenase nickel incorporation protein HypA/HybF